ncbi:MAG: DinB family protein [Candidatus Hodarchaeota archaeon]
MQDQIINAIASGLKGKWTHINPKKALVGLTPTIAKKKPNNDAHSCWELLHHIVVWQDAINRHIQGESIDWNEIEETDNWPTMEALKDDSNFDSLLNRFYSSIEETTNLVNSVDFTQTSAGKPELSVIKLFLVLLQHNSYHIGQIITVRKCIGDWPPTANSN